MDTALHELASSIAAHRLLQSLVVRKGNLPAGDRGECETDAGGDLLRADGPQKPAETGSSVLNCKNLVRFGTVGASSGPQVIELQGLGA